MNSPFPHLFGKFDDTKEVPPVQPPKAEPIVNIPPMIPQAVPASKVAGIKLFPIKTPFGDFTDSKKLILVLTILLLLIILAYIIYNQQKHAEALKGMRKRLKRLS